MQLRTAVVPVMLAALLAPSMVWAQGTPTLGQLAKKEQERRKKVKAPATKVLTNEDVPKGAAPPAAPPSESTTQATTPTQEVEKPQAPEKDEAWWRQRITQVREELRRNEMFADALQTRINSLTNDFSSRDDPFQRARVAEDRAKAIVELDRVKADIEANRKQIGDIEEEARKAGVPPGWLR
jgi:chromosome segregation ATPase